MQASVLPGLVSLLPSSFKPTGPMKRVRMNIRLSLEDVQASELTKLPFGLYEREAAYGRK